MHSSLHAMRRLSCVLVFTLAPIAAVAQDPPTISMSGGAGASARAASEGFAAASAAASTFIKRLRTASSAPPLRSKALATRRLSR